MSKDAKKKLDQCSQYADELDVLRAMLQACMKIPKSAVRKLKKLPVESKLRILEFLASAVFGIAPRPSGELAPLVPSPTDPAPGVDPVQRQPDRPPWWPSQPKRMEVVLYGCGPMETSAYMAPADWEYGPVSEGGIFGRIASWQSSSTVFDADGASIITDLMGRLPK